MFKHAQMRAITWHVGEIYKKHRARLEITTVDAGRKRSNKNKIKSHVVSNSIAAFCSHATADRNQRLQLLVSLDLLQPETKFDPTHF